MDKLVYLDLNSHRKIWVPTYYLLDSLILNTLRPRQNGRPFADEIFECIFLNENTSISINISVKFVPEDRINNIQASVGSDDGLAPTRRQAIIWTNDGKFTYAYMRHSASMS